MTYKEDITRKAIKYGLPTVTKKKFEENVGNDYRTIPTEEWIDLLRTLEARYDRRCTDCEAKKPTTKNKKADQTDGSDASSESSPRVYRMDHKPNPVKDKQQKTVSHRGTQIYCVILKK